MIKPLSILFVSNWGKTVFVSILSFALASCKSDDRITSAGSMSLASLRADTTSLHIGNKGNEEKITRSPAGDDLSFFLDVSDYEVYIQDASDAIIEKYERYDFMPAEVKLPEGSYILKACKGSNVSAGFECPYFEGSSSFVIRDNMKTSVDVTCTLANARVTVESTSDFDRVYSDYIVVLSTEYIKETADTTWNGVPIKKGETRPLYLRTDKNGTDVGITVYVKKPGETDSTAFYVKVPLKLEPRHSVRILLSLSETNQGIGIDVLLDDTLTKLSITTEIPDYMWEQMKEPVVRCVGFENDSTFSIDDSFDTDVNVSYEMSGGVSSLIIEYWKDGEEGFKTRLDLTDASDVDKALSYKLSWTAGNEENTVLDEQVRSGEIRFKEALQSFLASEENECLYHIQVYGTDATGKGFATDTVRFHARILPVEIIP